MISVGWLNKALFKYLENNPPKEIQSKPYHVHYEQVKTEIESIDIADLEAQVHINGGIYVDFMCRDDEEMSISEIFPFDGELSLNLLEQTIKNAKLNIDNSHQY